MKRFRIKLKEGSNVENVDGYAAFAGTQILYKKGQAIRKAQLLDGTIEPYEKPSYLADFRITGSGEAESIANELEGIAAALRSGDYRHEDDNSWESANTMTTFRVATDEEAMEIEQDIADNMNK